MVDISLLTAEELEQKEMENLLGKDDRTEDELNLAAAETMKKIVTKMIHEKNDLMANAYIDKVQLGTEGWKMRYYSSKFHILSQDFNEF